MPVETVLLARLGGACIGGGVCTFKRDTRRRSHESPAAACPFGRNTISFRQPTVRWRERRPGTSDPLNTGCCLGVRNEPGPRLAGLTLHADSGGGCDRRVGRRRAAGATVACVVGALVREQRAAVHDAFDGV